MSYFAKRRFLKTIQDVLWEKYVILMAECGILSLRIQTLKESLSPRELSAIMDSNTIKEIAQKEQEVLSQIRYCQKLGRIRFWKYFSVQETNDKLRIHIDLKKEHNDLLKESISILLDFVNGRKTAI